jgi:hypothetical protein
MPNEPWPYPRPSQLPLAAVSRFIGIRVTSRRMLILVLLLFGQGIAHAQTKITYDVAGLIDVADLLIIQGSEIQWYHPGSGAAVGRHSGANVATTISSTVDGVASLNDFAWIPSWPANPPAEIRYDAYSSVLSGLTPAMPSGSMSVEVSVLAGRGSASIQQYPDATNNWTLIVRFADGVSGAALLGVRISIEPVSLNLVSLDFAHWQVRWPTNNASFQLESAPSLPASPDGWIVVTNEPVVQGEYFTVPIDMTEPQKYFRLHNF